MFDETWIKVVIGVIVAIGWIVKTYQEAKAKPDAGKPPPVPQAEPDTEPIRQTPEKLNEFLEEIRKRKKKSKANDAEPIVLVEAEPERRPTPKPPIRRDKPAPRITQPSPWASTPAPSKVATEIPAAPRVPAKSATAASSLMGSAGVVERKKSIPAIGDALALLANRQSLATAFILREILADPISKRRKK